MKTEIEIGKIYKGKSDSNMLRKPFCIHGSFVYYEMSTIGKTVFDKDNASSWSVTEFLKNNEPYEPPKPIETVECVWMKRETGFACQPVLKDKVESMEKQGWQVVKVKIVGK